VVTAPPPPDPFDPFVEDLPAGAELFRVFASARGRTATTFNPGAGAPGRFSFFGDPVVPVLYAAQSVEAAVCETLLHDVPVSTAVQQLGRHAYRDKVAAKLRTRRPLRLAAFLGTGLRRLGVEAAQLTDTSPVRYGQTVAWAQAAHGAGLDGVVWMSKRCNSDRAYVLFGDRVTQDDLEVDDGFGLAFAIGPGLDWLVDFCSGVHVEVLTV